MPGSHVQYSSQRSFFPFFPFRSSSHRHYTHQRPTIAPLLPFYSVCFPCAIHCEYSVPRHREKEKKRYSDEEKGEEEIQSANSTHDTLSHSILVSVFCVFEFLLYLISKAFNTITGQEEINQKLVDVTTIRSDTEICCACVQTRLWSSAVCICSVIFECFFSIFPVAVV